MPLRNVAPLLATGAMLLAGCLDSDSRSAHSPDALVDTATHSATSVAFDPSNQVIPFPNNLLFEAGATTTEDLDGTLNVPDMASDDASAAIINALNDLDGFSTLSIWRLGFTGPVDATTLAGAVRVFRMKGAGDSYPQRVRPQGVAAELTRGEDYRLQFDNDTHVLSIQPLKPLQHDTSYTIIVTGDLLGADGHRVRTPLQWSAAVGSSQLAACDRPDKPDRATLQCMTRFAIDPVLADTELEKNDLLMGWGITTQRRDTTFDRLAEFITTDFEQAMDDEGLHPEKLITFFNAGSAELPDALPLFRELMSFSDSKEPGPRTPDGTAHVWPGVVHLPYWLEEPEQLQDRVSANENPVEAINAPAILEAVLQCGGDSCNRDSVVYSSEPSLPKIRHIQDVPIILATPDPDHEEVPPEDDFENGYPVVIFHHALQEDRTNALALADALAREGYATIAIDMPLHGVVPHRLDPSADSTEGRIALYAPALNNASDEAEAIFARRPLPRHYERHLFLGLIDSQEYAKGFDPEDYNEDQRQYLNPDVDPSGRHFLMPERPIAQRDLLRQGGFDLVALAHYLRQGWFHQTCLIQADEETLGGATSLSDLLSDAGIFPGEDDLALLDQSLLDDEALVDNCTAHLEDRLDFNRLHFVSHSASNLVASPFLAWDHRIETVSHLLPMAGIMRSLENSATIGPIFREQVGENGLEPGDEDYFRFMVSVQAALDAVDPINLAPDISNPLIRETDERKQRPIYISRIKGNSGDNPNPPDLILPLEVDDHPLAGSNSLAQAMGADFRPNADDDQSQPTVTLRSRNADGTAAPLQASLGFRFGSHASPLLPLTEDKDPRKPDPQARFTIPKGEAVHREMQRQVARFIASGGREIDQIPVEFVDGDE